MREVAVIVAVDDCVGGDREGGDGDRGDGD